MGILLRPVLDQADAVELTLEILSFAGGENTISEDQATKTEQARTLENWDALSLGGMQRTAGINQVGDGGAPYTAAPDLLIHHKDTAGTVLYGVIAGDLVKLSGTTIIQEDAAAFTSGLLCHAISVGDALWITNSTNNLKRKTVGVAIAAPASQPPTACDRIYNHKNRLAAEGSTAQPQRIYGSRTGKGNWTAADTWSLANDAWSIDLPNDTKGCWPGFPTGNEIMAFTEFDSFSLYNFPNTAYRPLGVPSHGCSAPYSIALGDEGVYFLSRKPTLGVFLFDGTQFIELTELNRDVFVEQINFSQRIYGVYRNRKYHLVYNESNSGVSYPNRVRIYDARFGRWMNRPINSSLSDNMGYPAILKYSQNELYMASSQKDKFYEFGTGTDDEGNDTQATYKTKDFSSRDFAMSSGGGFSIDDVRMKLVNAIITYNGTVGVLGLNWQADRGLHSGSKSISLTASGDLLNSTFILNSSFIVTSPGDKTKVITFPNDAVGRRFNFTLTNNGQSTIPKVKKVKIVALALDEA